MISQLAEGTKKKQQWRWKTLGPD